MAEPLALISKSNEITSHEIALLSAGLDHALSERQVPADQALAFVATPDSDAVSFALSLLHLGRPIVPLHARWTHTETRAALATLPAVRSITSDEFEQCLLDRSVNRADSGAVRLHLVLDGTSQHEPFPTDPVCLVGQSVGERQVALDAV